MRSGAYVLAELNRVIREKGGGISYEYSTLVQMSAKSTSIARHAIALASPIPAGRSPSCQAGGDIPHPRPLEKGRRGSCRGRQMQKRPCFAVELQTAYFQRLPIPAALLAFGTLRGTKSGAASPTFNM
jgi:hypothetical protein